MKLLTVVVLVAVLACVGCFKRNPASAPRSGFVHPSQDNNRMDGDPQPADRAGFVPHSQVQPCAAEKAAPVVVDDPDVIIYSGSILTVHGDRVLGPVLAETKFDKCLKEVGQATRTVRKMCAQSAENEYLISSGSLVSYGYFWATVVGVLTTACSTIAFALQWLGYFTKTVQKIADDREKGYTTQQALSRVDTAGVPAVPPRLVATVSPLSPRD